MGDDKQKGVLIKTLRVRRKLSPNSETKYDCLYLWWRDENDVKHCDFIDRPMFEYYILKDRNSEYAKLPPLYIHEDLLEKKEVRFDDLYYDVAKETGTLGFLDSLKFNPNIDSYSYNNLFKSNLLYSADTNIEDRYIEKFYNEHELYETYTLEKAYFDIEVDLMPHGDPREFIGFPDENVAPCPINIITLIDDHMGKEPPSIYSFICRNKLNTSLVEFETKVKDFVVYLTQKIKEDDKTEIKEIIINFYDKEDEVIAAFFKKMHELNPDYAGAWNQAFDCKTMIKRQEKLYNANKNIRASGRNPQTEAFNTINDLRYVFQKSYLGKDIQINMKPVYTTREKDQIGERLDSFSILDGTLYVDQMYLYALIHIPSEGRLDSYSLNSVADHLVGRTKVPLKSGEIKTLPWTDFWKFAEYNIRDVLLLYLIEERVKDFDLMHAMATTTRTRAMRTFSQSTALTNYVASYAHKVGIQLATNKNISYGEAASYYEANFMDKKEVLEENQEYADLFKKKDKFGALVMDPNLNNHNGVEIIKDSPSMYIYNNVFDLDLSALYPSTISAFNLDTSTFKYKYFLVDNACKKKAMELGFETLFVNKSDDGKKVVESDELGPLIADELVAQNWAKVGNIFMGLPSAEDAIKDLDPNLKK